MRFFSGGEARLCRRAVFWGVEQCSPSVTVRHLHTGMVLARDLTITRGTIFSLLKIHSRRNRPLPVFRSGRRQHYFQMYMETTKPAEWSIHSDECARNHCRCPAKTRCEPS